MEGINSRIQFGNEFLAELRELNRPSKPKEGSEKNEGSKDFMSYIKESVNEVENAQKQADQMAVNLANGKDTNLHETMLAATQAELSLQLMVQVRNKVLEAYQDVMRMQV